jgi:subtilisin family serine protease
MKNAVNGFAALAAAILFAVFLTGTAGARQGSNGEGARTAKGVSDVYIVLLEEAPVAAYRGGITGYPATKPAAGKKLDRTNANVQKYAGYLNSRHDAVAKTVGATRIYDYAYSLNGFAAALTKGQVAKLRATKGVVSVQRDTLSHPDTDNTPTFLGLNAGGGIWSQLGGQSQAGEGVVIGVVDTGVWPEHPSFSGAGYGPPPATWHGTCQTGEQWTKSNCNNKLIGARYYTKGFGHFGGGLSGDFQSARDHEGHGTHTASTAGGNANVTATIVGNSLGQISGMAPRARIAAYKACWPGGCAATDLTAAIDDAVADGVDVINYSIGDSDPDFLDSDDLAFLFARQANVFVAASAGNEGPGPSTVDHGGPWLTTVGASTQNRSFVGTVRLGNGQTFKGVQITNELPSTPLVDGKTAGTDSTGCLTGLDPAKVTGKIVLCEGSFSRAARSRAVKAAGGVGMILYTAAENDTLMSDTHHVPTVHVQNSAGLAIRAYIASAGNSATASLSGVSKELGGGNTMAAFSSRGPLPQNDRSTGDLLKPDITAPGVQILAGNTPLDTNALPGQLFQAIGGTSMSSPHIAGIGALLRDLHPNWTPAEMQSAIMTSARQNVFKQDGVTPADPFDFGAGHVVPNGAANPGLVYPVAFDDYRAFLRSQGLCTFCFGTSPAPVAAPTALNVPSVTIRALAGVRTVTRTVKNVGPDATYRVNVVAPAGIDVSVSPSRLTLASGATASYQLSLVANENAAFGSSSFGSVTWSDRGGHDVRIPLVVRPVKLAAPAAITGTTTSGSQTVAVQLGYQGPFSAAAQGLVAATTTQETVSDDPTNNFDTSAPNSNQGIVVHDFNVATGTTLARFQLFDEFTDGEDDLDIYLYKVGTGGSLTLVGQSAGGTAAERIDVPTPAAGAYKLYVHGWQTDGTNAVYTLFNWFVPSTAAGNLSVSSSTSNATVGGTANVTVSWSGLTAGTKYLGRVSYRDGSGEIGSTIVNVNP